MPTYHLKQSESSGEDRFSVLALPTCLNNYHLLVHTTQVKSAFIGWLRGDYLSKRRSEGEMINKLTDCN